MAKFKEGAKKYKVGQVFSSGTNILKITNTNNGEYYSLYIINQKRPNVLDWYDFELDLWELLPLYNSPLYKAMEEE